MNNMNSLTGVYPLSKTLAFKLIPVGNTDSNIRKSGILSADEELEQDFTQLKKLADDFHKDFIEDVLTDMKLILKNQGMLNSLEEYVMLYESDRKNNKELQDDFEAVQQALRTQIAEAFLADRRFEKMNKKELVTEFLAGRAEGTDKVVVERFKNFTSYLQGYNTSRMQFYSDNGKTYTIPYRLINDNLPAFYFNIKQFEVVKEIIGEETLQKIYNDFEPYLNVNHLDEMFTIENFNNVLTQTQIEVYNSILNGIKTEKSQQPGINHYVHMYNQQLPKNKKKIPSLKKLKKQILSERVKLSWIDEEFTTSKEMACAIKEFHTFYTQEVEKALRTLLLDIDKYDPEGILLRNDKELTQISLVNYGRWNAINEELLQVFSDKVPSRKRKESETDFFKRVNKYVTSIKSFSLADIDRYMFACGKSLITYFQRMGASETTTKQNVNHFVAISNAWTDLVPLINRLAEDNVKHIIKASDNMKVKNYLDALQTLLHFIKPLRGKGDEAEQDTSFYEIYDELYEKLSQVIPLYNRTRNYLTRKPFSTKKLKLNFGSPTLMGGWSRDKERVSRSCILRRDGWHYLAILDKTGLDAFKNPPAGTEGHSYEKMYYDLFGDASKMLPKIAFAASNAELYQPTDEILRIRKEGSYKAGKTFNLEDLHTLIDFYKQCMARNPKWSQVKFPWKPTAEYTSIKQFTDDFIGYDYVIEFQSIDEEYINKLVDEGKIHLFQIYNKDLSPFSKGKKSLYTQYFNMLFDPRNLQNVVYKLSGGAEMFFRKASLHPAYPTHPAGVPIENKRPSQDGTTKKRVFTYDLIKDRRYTKDQYMLHLPVALNYSVVEPKGMPVTARVRQLIREGAFKHIIGINRGEKNLVYVTVIDMKGHIIEQKSLNIIESEGSGDTIYTDYNELLQRRSDERQQARKDWQFIENIKNIKEGYLSQAVSKLTDMILKYEALVVMESLNDKFMNSRMKIEKNVYHKFNKQLVDKLNYLVKKDRAADEPGGLLKAYQLTDISEGTTFQNGIIFYVQAAYTSAVCPVTGFISLFRLYYENMESVNAFFSKFDTIRYHAAHDRFEFSFDYTAFTDKADGSRTRWTISTHGQRVHNYKDNGKWFSEEINLTAAYRRLFTSYGIDITGNLKEAIANVGKRSFYEELVELFNLTVQMRNSSTSLDRDYIVSPVVLDDGTWFQSNPSKPEWPIDTDANAAYNIARKGSIVINNIAVTPVGEKVKMGISNTEWFNYVQGQHS